ncbi:BCCT family transporter [Geosporobacter ferrireducens]|uniref:BCCT transporter n=1 Tax=Geosporobacter ferrireducens TaxID=1424294 RepID=A0A1D8GDA8_9FIRM|nr:BCCT family transporter [Geosporobacter ferrireducens]AOT68887.1 BCCT transporter [Geosporobacter ferrireducens]MTI54879.1 BCCT transporter [Geosporobacter ferrireducens]
MKDNNNEINTLEGENHSQKKFGLRWGVIIAPVSIFAALIVLGFTDSSAFLKVLWGIFEKLMVSLGWLVDLGCLSFVIFLAVLCFHPVGKIKFGGKDAKPRYSTWNWWAISICAGIGTGIVFWAAPEPLLFSMEPAPGVEMIAGSRDAIIWAMRTSFLHWTFTPYAIYITIGVIVGYAYYNMRKPYNISSGFVPMIGDKALGNTFSTTVDALTVFAITGGVAGSLGYGLLQIGSGLKYVFGIEPGPVVWVGIAMIIIVAYNISSISGLDKGIKWLSDKNAWAFIVFMIFALIFGPTSYILNLTTQSMGAFLNNFLEAMTFTDPFPDSGLWPQWWDMYWFVDWLSFGPIVGLFLIKLCYGRTIREFIVVNWLLPSVFGMIWFGVFGGLTLNAQFNLGYDLYGFMQANGLESVMLKIFDFLPLATILRPLMIILIILSFVTLADSMTSTVSLMTLKNNMNVKEAPAVIKLCWGLLMGLTSIIFVLNGGLEGIKVVKTLAGFPILFIEIAMMVGFIVYMYNKPKEEIEEKVEKSEVV